MKTTILAFSLVAIIGATLVASDDLRDGRPGCKTDAEMEQVYYRNFWDANAYWVCKTKGEPAEIERCEEGGFQASENKCVDWDDWIWENPVAPPSKP